MPRPEQPFKGHIGRKAKDSIKEFPQEVAAPKGAPNVLLILTDDVGFGAASTFGGPIETKIYLFTYRYRSGVVELSGDCARMN